jgi:hypothetical protein
MDNLLLEHEPSFAAFEFGIIVHSEECNAGT